MEVNIKKLPDSKIELNIKISPEEFKQARRKALSQLSASVEVKGFRKGHVPLEIIEKEVSQEEILGRASEVAVREHYVKAILENNIEAISQPKIEILKQAPGSAFEFKAETQVLPEVILPDYKAIAQKAKKQEIKIDQKEIEDTLSWLQQSRAKFSAVARKAKTGDFVEIEFSCPDIENGQTKKDAFILGQGHLIPGFEEELEHMESGQEKEFSLTFPKKHAQEELSGQQADFKVKMISVQKVELPEINDEFAKGMGQFEDLLKLKESIKQGALKEKEKEEVLRIRKDILKCIVEKVKCEVPSVLIEREKTAMMGEMKREVSERFKMKPEEYFSSIKKKEEELLESFLPEAEKRVKEFLVLKAISKKEGIKVSEEEIAEELNKILKQYPDIKTAKSKVDLERLGDYTREMIINEKILSMLEGLAKDSK